MQNFLSHLMLPSIPDKHTNHLMELICHSVSGVMTIWQWELMVKWNNTFCKRCGSSWSPFKWFRKTAFTMCPEIDSKDLADQLSLTTEEKTIDSKAND